MAASKLLVPLSSLGSALRLLLLISLTYSRWCYHLLRECHKDALRSLDKGALGHRGNVSNLLDSRISCKL